MGMRDAETWGYGGPDDEQTRALHDPRATDEATAPLHTVGRHAPVAAEDGLRQDDVQRIVLGMIATGGDNARTVALSSFDDPPTVAIPRQPTDEAPKAGLGAQLRAALPPHGLAGDAVVDPWGEEARQVSMARYAERGYSGDNDNLEHLDEEVRRRLAEPTGADRPARKRASWLSALDRRPAPAHTDTPEVTDVQRPPTLSVSGEQALIRAAHRLLLSDPAEEQLMRHHDPGASDLIQEWPKPEQVPEYRRRGSLYRNRQDPSV